MKSFIHRTLLLLFAVAAGASGVTALFLFRLHHPWQFQANYGAFDLAIAIFLLSKLSPKDA